MRRGVVLLPVRETAFVDVDVVVLNAPQLLREHVRVLAIAAGAIDDDRLGLLLRVAALFEKFLHFLVDVRFPNRERTRTGDVALFVNRSATRVEEENFFVVELFDGVVGDFDVWLVGVGSELWRGCRGVAGLWVATTVDNSGNVAVPTSIAIDSLNQPHIAYLGGGLKYAHKVGGAWVTEMVDSTIGFAEWPLSIKIAAGDFADISYYDGTNFDLKLARQMTNNAWNFIVIDSDTAGEYSSLAIDSAGVLRIAYFNSGHQDLRYAINQ